MSRRRRALLATTAAVACPGAAAPALALPPGNDLRIDSALPGGAKLLAAGKRAFRVTVVLRGARVDQRRSVTVVP